MQEMQVQSLGPEDSLEEEMATQPSVLAWEIPRQRSLVGCSPWGPQELGTTEGLNTHPCTWPAATVSHTFSVLKQLQ